MAGNRVINVVAYHILNGLGLMLATSYQDYAMTGNNGESDTNSAVLEKVLGHSLTSLSEALRELL